MSVLKEAAERVARCTRMNHVQMTGKHYFFSVDNVVDCSGGHGSNGRDGHSGQNGSSMFC
jgi:hypothetical protein